ncbi:MAG: hypothetical protein ACRD9S_25255 [Pyrinomonadaceae bacterium]
MPPYNHSLGSGGGRKKRSLPALVAASPHSVVGRSQRSVRHAHETRKWTSIVRAAHATLAERPHTALPVGGYGHRTRYADRALYQSQIPEVSHDIRECLPTITRSAAEVAKKTIACRLDGNKPSFSGGKQEIAEGQIRHQERTAVAPQ